MPIIGFHSDVPDRPQAFTRSTSEHEEFRVNCIGFIINVNEKFEKYISGMGKIAYWVKTDKGTIEQSGVHKQIYPCCRR